MKQHCIKNWLTIRNSEIIISDESFFKSEENNLEIFLKSVYRHLKLDYPKFFKMDPLSKLAFLGSEILFWHHRPPKETALVFSNAASSLQTDISYYEIDERISFAFNFCLYLTQYTSWRDQHPPWFEFGKYVFHQ